MLLALGVHGNHEALAAALQAQLVGVVGEVELREAHLHAPQPALLLAGLGKAGGFAAGVGRGVLGAGGHVGPQRVGLALGIHAEAVAQHGQHRAFGAARYGSQQVQQVAFAQALGERNRRLALEEGAQRRQQGFFHSW